MNPSKGIAGINPTDFAFSLVKLLAIAGGLVWGFYHPFPPRDRVVFLWLLGAFFVYTFILYLCVFKFPDKTPRLYFLEFILDLTFLSLVVPLTGGLNSAFALAFFLIAAVQSFYYGLLGSVGIGFLVSFAYIFSCPHCLYLVHWTDLLLRVIFLFLICVTLGYLSERERRIHRQLVNAEQLAAMGIMSSQLAHAVRNPLSTISLSAELLADEIKKSKEADTREAGVLIDSIMSEVGKVNDVVEDHLSFIRRSKSEQKDCNVNATVESLIRFMEKEGDLKGISFLKILDEKLPRARIEENRLRQVLLNVIRNSFDAMPMGGQIRISTKTRKDDIEIIIEDTGAGIPREHMKRIFHPFFTTKDVGTGLGLYIARDIALECGGGISCDSKEGRGTTVKIRLPLAAQT